jgi:hypothetical protein
MSCICCSTEAEGLVKVNTHFRVGTHPLVSGMYSHMRIHMGTDKAPYTKPDLTPSARSIGGVA